ncbi:molybdopterin-dependent oxidoreductase [Effusibacillus lacus]|uniref:molybdopterin-dependent oxidoreductase n=1 Tax=Effusibacillus lacus TaxID=1348429 RepID=UPI0014042E80|nr:molybdopterin-dependent oxidoreductase [Effusibacillus lacus]
MVLWQNHPVFLDYRIGALLVHDWLSVVIVPWVFLHISWKLLKKRFGDRTAVKFTGKYMSRREFLTFTAGAVQFFMFGFLLKWLRPFLTEEETVQMLNRRRGYFRIFKVTSEIPKFEETGWKLTVDGLVETPRQFSFSDLKHMEWRKIVRDFHCVTGWSVIGAEWNGIPFPQFVELVKPKAEGIFVKMYSSDKLYTETYTLNQLMNQDVLLVFHLDGKPLTPSQGAPCRLFHPGMYGYKSIKWVERIEFVNTRELGYWEAAERYDLDGYIETG